MLLAGICLAESLVVFSFSLLPRVNSTVPITPNSTQNHNYTFYAVEELSSINSTAGSMVINLLDDNSLARNLSNFSKENTFEVPEIDTLENYNATFWGYLILHALFM